MIATLIRHTSVAVAPGICYGQSDVDVAPSFADEARAVAERLAGARYDAVYASPLRRCRKLADYCGYRAPRVDERLMEMNFGDWELQAWDAIRDPQLERWYADWINEAPSNGESLRALVARVAQFVAELRCEMRRGEAGGERRAGERRIAIFTHAGVIRAFAVALGSYSVDTAFELKVDYGQCFDFDLA